jgi:hypothetical protein
MVVGRSQVIKHRHCPSAQCPVEGAANDSGNGRFVVLEKISPIQDARNCDMELFADLLVRCVLDCGCRLSPAEGGAFLGGFGLGVAQPARRAAAGRERVSGPTRRVKWAKK